MLTYILFIIGVFLLLKGGDLLVDGASSFAKNRNISPIVIGLTIVAFGTSAPEMIVNVIAAFSGNTDIAIGNVLGSNIVNIFLILGISAMIYPISAKRNTVLKEIPFSLLAAVLVAFTANDVLIDKAAHSEISRIDGLVYLLFFCVFMYYIFGITRSENDILEVDVQKTSDKKAFLFIFLGLVGLFFGGKWIVEGAVQIAKTFEVSESLIGLTIVAIGTSLPEMATSAIAAFKKQTDIAIGNVVGSNIFNIFWVLGLSSIIRPLPFNEAGNVDILMTIASSLLLFWFMFIGNRRMLDRWKGLLMTLIYIMYLAYLIVLRA